ncbi:hypothetical protein [Terriglobus sp.]|uniref:hypothetical protein n=1 Tax=Terriglobus sp. TaxID=1889013 RepID=UPI003AFFA071
MPVSPFIAQQTAPLRSYRDLPITVSYLALFFTVLLVFLLRPLSSGVFWMKYMQDDFFYYLKVAQNIADGHGSTFGGIAKTNGYHPLYELLWVVFSYVAHSSRSILLLQALLILLASIATMLLAIHVLRSMQVRLLTAAAFASWAVIYALRIFYNGMEVTLTIPLALAFLAVVLRWSWWTRSFIRSAVLGLLASLVVLSRLDALILIVVVFACILAHRSLRTQIRPANIFGVLLGMQPITIYVILNRVWFGTALPISGMAKQLKPGLYPSVQTWAGLNLNQPAYFAVTCPVFVALGLLPVVWKRFEPLQRSVIIATLVFPWLYYLAVSLRSDWTLWAWYLYPLRIAIIFSFAVFCAWPPLGNLLQRTPSTFTLCVLLFVPLFFDPWRIQLPELYDRAVDVSRFANTHPGTYAMGDGAGAVGYLVHQPFVQLEGLMMDRNYLNLIRNETSLRRIFQAYRVDYYIATYYRAGNTNFHTDRSTLLGTCLSAVEPSLGGPTSPKSRDRFCQEPVFQTQYAGTHTVIYHVGQGSAASAPVSDSFVHREPSH